MATIESTGTSSELKEQYEKHEKFVFGFLFSPPKEKQRRKRTEVK